MARDPEREPPDRPRGPMDEPAPPRDFDERRGPDSREGGFPFPLPRLARPNFVPLEDGPVETMLAQADDYASKNPQNFKHLIDRYRQVLSKARGTAVETEISDKLESVIARHQETIRQVMRTYEARMDEKMRAGNSQEAYDVWRDFPQHLRTRESDQQIQQTLQRTLPPGFVPR
jgi:hypothetical protein